MEREDKLMAACEKRIWKWCLVWLERVLVQKLAKFELILKGRSFCFSVSFAFCVGASQHGLISLQSNMKSLDTVIRLSVKATSA